MPVGRRTGQSVAVEPQAWRRKLGVRACSALSGGAAAVDAASGRGCDRG